MEPNTSETELVELNPRLSLDPMRSNDDVEVFTARYASYESLEIAGLVCEAEELFRALARVTFCSRLCKRAKTANGFSS
ncbi:MAG: hypothetical protein CM1200mP39_30140 [Dehalococcoidia bacterium]|nr:MAG: hypothetical protein CM1200mP39_30140 [Dehalococcoidia bacterium]